MYVKSKSIKSVFFLLQRCTRWCDTGLTRINSQDVATATGAGSRATSRSLIPSPIPSTITMGSQPAPAHIRAQAFNSHCYTPSSSSIPKTLQASPLPSHTTTTFTITELSFLHLTLSYVSDLGPKS